MPLFVTQTGLTEVRTSTSPRSSVPPSSVIPTPPAAFSALATIKSGEYFCLSRGRHLRSARRPGWPMISPMKRKPSLSGIFHGPHLADDGDLDLPRIIELVLALLGDVLGHQSCPVIGDLLALDDNPDLPAGLEGEGLGDAVEGVGDLLELLPPLDVGLEKFPPRPRPPRRYGVRGLHEDGRARR